MGSGSAQYFCCEKVIAGAGGILSSCLRCGSELGERPYHRNCSCSLHDTWPEDDDTKVAVSSGSSGGSGGGMRRCNSSRVSLSRLGSAEIVVPEIGKPKRSSSHGDLVRLSSHGEHGNLTPRGSQMRRNSASFNDLSKAAVPPVVPVYQHQGHHSPAVVFDDLSGNKNNVADHHHQHHAQKAPRAHQKIHTQKSLQKKKMEQSVALPPTSVKNPKNHVDEACDEDRGKDEEMSVKNPKNRVGNLDQVTINQLQQLNIDKIQYETNNDQIQYQNNKNYGNGYAFSIDQIQYQNNKNNCDGYGFSTDQIQYHINNDGDGYPLQYRSFSLSLLPPISLSHCSAH